MSDTTRSVKIVIDSLSATESAEKLRSNIERLEKQLKSLVLAGKLETNEYKKVAKQRDEQTQKLGIYQNKVKDVERVLKNLSGATYKELISVQKQIDTQLKNTVRGTDKHKNLLLEYRRVSELVVAAQKEMRGELSKQNSMWTWLKGGFATLIGNLATKGVSLLAGALKSAFNTIKEFEQANANLATILGTSRKEISDLTNNAKKLGAETEWTAAKVTELQTELAKLGFTKLEILNATKPILGFATALQANLSEAAEVTGAALRAFGLDASETERVVGVMTVAANKSALSFEYIKTSLATVAPVAKAFGFSIEDVMSLLGTLSDAGFDASTAATSTRNILLNLADANGKLAKALGTPVKSINDLVPALIKLRDSGVDLNTTLELTDKRSVAAFNRFLDGAESIASLRGELNNVEGELDRIREEQLNTTEGSIKKLSSAWEGLILSFSNSSGAFKDIIDSFTTLVNWINKAIKARDDYYKVPTETSWYKQMIEDSKTDHATTFTKSFEKRIVEGYSPEKIYEIEKAQTNKFLKELQEDMDNFMMRRQQSINNGILKQGQWSKADTDYYNNLKMKIDSTTVSLESLDDVYKKFKTPETTKPTTTTKKEGKETDVKAGFDLQLKALENEYRRRQLIIKKNDEKEWTTEQEKQRTLSDAEYDYLYSRIALMEKFKTSNAKLSGDITNKILEDELKLQENHRKFEQSLIDNIRKEEKEKLDIIQAAADAERSSLKVQYDSREITREQYDARILLLDRNTADARLQVLRATGKSLENLTIRNEDLKINAVEQSGKEIVAAEQKTQEAVAALKKNYFESDKTILEQYGKVSIEQQKQQELAHISAMRNHTVKDDKGNDVANPLISAEAAKVAELAIEKKYEDEKLKVRQEYAIAGMNEIHRSELDALKQKLDQEFLTEEEYAQAKTQLKLKHAKEYADKVGEFTQAGSNLVQALTEAETAKISAEYTERQSALTEQYNQGLISQEDYNKEKEKLDYEQKVEELNVQKKYADVNFAIQAAEIIATTAQGIMTAWATSMTLGPIAGPIAAGIMTGILAMTSIAQLARAKAERDRVKAMTIEAPGGGSSSTPTGARVLNQAADGRYDVIGADDGKTYRSVPYLGAPKTGILATPTIVAESGKELIVSAPDLKRLEKHINYPLVISAINDARAGTVPQRAKGNYANLPDDTQEPRPVKGNELVPLMEEIRDFLRDLKSGVNIKARAAVSLTDLKAAQELEKQATSIFTKGNKL